MILEKTRVFTVSKNADTEEDIRALRFAADVIRRGGLVVFPTETVYGLGANALDADAARSIYVAKGRPSNNPLIIHLHDKASIPDYCDTENVRGADVLTSLMPAPLTVILPAKDIIPRVITAGGDSVAVRVPTSVIARKLIELSGVPIAAPSANLSGKPSPTCARHVLEDMDGVADVIIDGGDCEVGVESTIVTLCLDTPTLLRPGGITYETLCALLGDVAISDAVLNALMPGEKVLSPGMMYKHYAPDRPVTLVKGGREACIAYVNARCEEADCAVICYGEDEAAISSKAKAVFSAGSRAANEEYAAKIFTMLRDTNSVGCSRVYAFLPPSTEGISLAIYNRLLRAAGFTVVETGDIV